MLSEDALFAILSFPESKDGLARIAALVHRFECSLTDLLSSEGFQATIGTSVEAGLAAIPQENRRKLAQSPQLVWILTNWRKSSIQPDIRALSQLVLAELASVGAIGDLPFPVWTARGREQIRAPGAPNAIKADWKLGDDTDVDYASPQLFPYNGSRQNLLLPLSEGDAETTVKTLKQSMEVLSAICPSTHDCSRRVLKQVSLRSQPGLADQFSVATFRRHIGLLLLVNPQLRTVNTSAIVEALVSSTVENLLYMIEELDGPFVSDPEIAVARVLCPWTGGRIELEAYLRRLFVWNALFRFWTQPGSSDRVLSRERDELAERAQSGFMSDPLAPLSQWLSAIDPAVWIVLERVTRHVLGTRPV